MSHLAKIKEKGISPLIASVLLLAFALAIAGIFSEWSNSLVMDAQERNTDRQDKLIDCNNRRIEVISVEENYGSNELQVLLRDHGGEIGNVSVTAFPSLARGFLENNFTSDGQVERVTLNVSSQQDRLVVSSMSCPISTEEELG